MRFDKFTTKLQEALAEAQSAALGSDNQYIEPQHLLLALANDPGITGLIAAPIFYAYFKEELREKGLI